MGQLANYFLDFMSPFLIFVGRWRLGIYFGIIFIDVIWTIFDVAWLLIFFKGN